MALKKKLVLLLVLLLAIHNFYFWESPFSVGNAVNDSQEFTSEKTYIKHLDYIAKIELTHVLARQHFSACYNKNLNVSIHPKINTICLDSMTLGIEILKQGT